MAATTIPPSACATFATSLSLLLISTFLLQGGGVHGAIGVNYGTVADNLPPPPEVAQFLLKSTTINRVRLFDANPDILGALAHTGIAVTVTVPNDQIPRLTKLSSAHQWLQTNVQPYIPATDIVRILVGNEVISTASKLLIASLVPAMQALHAALVDLDLDRRIKISTPHSLGILSTSTPPSTGKFRQGYDTHVLKPLLEFLRDTDSPFMVNPYPFFGCSAETLDYALFRPNAGVLDENTDLKYTNMLDAQLDAVFSAIKGLGFADLDIVIAETGWPSDGDQAQFGVDPISAAEYNGNLLRHVTSGVGTPLMPNRTFETYVFALFNEDLKPGPICERNFGLFRPDLTPVYDIGILRPTARSSVPESPTQGPSPGPMAEARRPVPPHEESIPRFNPSKRHTLTPPESYSPPRVLCSVCRDGPEMKENVSPTKQLKNVACGILAVWAVTTASPVVAASQRLPPLSTEPNRCERAFVGNTIGQANGVYDKPLDLRFCDYANDKSNLKGKSLAAALMSDAKFDGADMSEVVMSKAYAVGASFKGVDFSNAVIDRVNFGKADLQGAIFRNTVLSGSTFDDAKLEDAVFEDTIIGYIDLQKLCTNKSISPDGRIELGCR